MDYLSAFEISASGMAVEKTRLDTVALNLANINTTTDKYGGLYTPLRVVSQVKYNQNFDHHFNNALNNNLPAGVEVSEIRQLSVEPRLVYEPSHPHADTNGFVSYPGINHVTEMVTMIESLRVYQANVKAVNAAKTMAQQALEIGSGK